MRLFRRAKSVSVADSLTKRINENIAQLQEWIDDRAEQDRFSEIEKEIEQLKSHLDNFQNLSARYRNASDLILSCRPLLQHIGEKLGKNDELYLKLSSAVVKSSQGMMAEIINVANQRFYESIENRQITGGEMNAVISILDDANRIKNLLSGFDMDSETRDFFNQDNQVVDSLYLQFAWREVVVQKTPAKNYAPPKQKTNRPDDLFSSASLASPSVFAPIANIINRNPIVFVVGLVIFLFIASIFSGLLVDSPKVKQSNNSSNFSNQNANRIYSNTNTKSISNSLPSNIKTVRPKNGETIFASSKDKGYGSLLIENGADNDAIAKLVDLNTGKTYKQVYIQSRNNYTISGIRSGTFALKFSTGRDYSADNKKFTTNESFEKFDEALNFTVTRTSSGVQWKNYRATLNRVANGTATTSPIDANDFADK